MKKFLNYYYPENKDQWIQETALDEDRFQNAGTEGDCGYHLINFMEGACKNEQIHTKGIEFIEFKNSVHLVMESERKKILEETEELNSKKKEREELNKRKDEEEGNDIIQINDPITE